MIYNRTYSDNDTENEINDLIGKSFSFLKILKLGGVGSSRFIIESASEKFLNSLNKVADINYCNIELRPKGVMVNITQQLNLHSWVIPYYKLVIFDSQSFSIHSDGLNIKLTKDRNYRNNKSFNSKMMKLKNEYLKNIESPLN
jgi:hypothetical protein|tara:strand:+ start:1416 stop:1844 length:429 start_codon:yes stop_codon:yes gene_type:complete